MSLELAFARDFVAGEMIIHEVPFLSPGCAWRGALALMELGGLQVVIEGAGFSFFS